MNPKKKLLLKTKKLDIEYKTTGLIRDQIQNLLMNWELMVIYWKYIYNILLIDFLMKNLDPRVVISKQIEEWFSSLSNKNQKRDLNVFYLIKKNQLSFI